MSEQGIVTDARSDGGIINGNITYDASVIVGTPPIRFQQVVFSTDDPSNPRRATRVQLASSALAHQLGAEFAAVLDGAALDSDAWSEVARITQDRAARVSRPLADNKTPSSDVTKARLALARAAMALMAIEAGSQGEITATSLRDALRGQRPRLPRR